MTALFIILSFDISPTGKGNLLNYVFNLFLQNRVKFRCVLNVFIYWRVSCVYRCKSSENEDSDNEDQVLRKHSFYYSTTTSDEAFTSSSHAGVGRREAHKYDILLFIIIIIK